MKHTATSLLLGSLLAVAGPLHGMPGADPDVFFKPGPTAPENLAPDQVYPVGRLFPFSFFSIGGGTETKLNDIYSDEVIQKDFEHYKTLGIPIFGPQYELNSRALKDAQAYDLKVAYAVGLPLDFHKGTPEVNAEEVEAAIRRQVEEVMDNPRIAFWYLRPEELRPWRKPEMAYLQAASRAVRGTDPLRRPLWVYDPAHANASRLASIAPWVGYLGKGLYPNYASMKDDRVWCRWAIEQEVEAIKASGADAVPIAVPEMFQQPADADLGKIPAWARHDVYLSLISGAKGVIIFSARRRPEFPARDTYYKAYADVARELLGPLNLGQVFLFGEPRTDLEVDVIEGPAELEMRFPSGGVKEPIVYPSVASYDVAYGNDRYLFVVNSANKPVKIAVGGMPYNVMRAESLFEKNPAFDIAEGEFVATLAPLEVKGFRLTRR